MNEPHPYKTQRKWEKEALEARKRCLDGGGTLPEVCGYTYKPRKPRNPNVKFDPAPTVCMRVAGAGTDHHGRGYCDYHDWQAEKETSKAGAQVQKLRQEVAKRVEFLGKPVPTDPHTALLDEVQRSAGTVEWLREKMVEMALELEQKKDLPHIQEDGTQYHPGSDSLLVQWTLKDGQKPSAWMQLYQEERAHLLRACTAAIKAGVAERRVQIAEQQGQLIVAMFHAFIHDKELGLSPEQIMMAPQLIRKHMAALPREQAKPHEGQAVIEATVASS